jgi:hypothetical protein
MERFFQLAKHGPVAGWVGQITSNSFMKREFGAPLIEKFLANKDLRLIVDTSGAFIPGHGTPTVIIVGGNQGRQKETVRAVLGIRGEPGRPEVAAEGLVWSSIVRNLSPLDYEDAWISVVDVPRSTLGSHPWSLTGGGADKLLGQLNAGAVCDLAAKTLEAGFGAVTREDSSYLVGAGALGRASVGPEYQRPMVLGDNVRDWSLGTPEMALWPYDARDLSSSLDASGLRILWPTRSILTNRIAYGNTQIERGLSWFEYSMFFAKRYAIPLSITFAFVTTHNHFVFDRGGKVFNRSAPVIKLSEGATEDDHLRLLGVLNSSTACFWLKQNSHDKGSQGVNEGVKAEPWERFFEFTGTTLQDFPLPSGDALDRARRLDQLAQRLAALAPGAVIERSGPDRLALQEAETEAARIRALMIAEQEELDWEVYRLYGLIDEDLTYPHPSDPDTTEEPSLPGIALGERPFEIALARKVQAGRESTEWFARHSSTPITGLPDRWPADYAKLVQRRLELIESDRFINLLERPEYKRRWQSEPWSVRLTRALRDHLLDRLEDRSLWFNDQGLPQARSVGEIAGIVEIDSVFAGFTDALDQWVGRKGESTTVSLTRLLESEGVPYLAALRYKDSGLRKRAEWEHTWAEQRKEDDGTRDPNADPITVPPKYTGADFVKQSYWSHHGKLDVPKERFIAYPGAGRATDLSPLLGWAGWNHAQQGLALGRIITDRSAESSDPTVLTPLVAGVAELLPWIKQWHSGPDPELGIDLAEYLDAQIDAWTDLIGLPRQDLQAWRPPKGTRGRRAAATHRRTQTVG